MSDGVKREAGERDRDFEFAAFISYTTDPDYRLARRVESFIEAFHTQTRSSGLEIEPLQGCRDGSDFTAVAGGTVTGTGAPSTRRTYSA